MKITIIIASMFLCGLASAQTLQRPDMKIRQVDMGSGAPTNAKERNATIAQEVGDYGVYFAPQYMPGYPTAATIWPRVVNVRCDGDMCEGYENSPALGRGEYLFFKPIQVVSRTSLSVVTPLPPVGGRNVNKKFNR